ncbi:MAG: SMC family ATPase [Ruminococcus sp.]|jgi:exonuclease SbcC|nr:SMC family ATPase [Ruminococcus sp.]
MRPIKLTISAFVCYAGVETVDFTAFGNNGIYLISGETGSGKTTIFDAVSYALYGSASGDARSNHYLMFRSDFALEKSKTFVELEFMCGEKIYKINRTIKKNTQDVELTLADGTVLSGDRNVTPKVSALIGLERNQFAQIVMIAQNDFLRFLQSETKDRTEIMRKIFNTGSFLSFQINLKKKFNIINNERNIILSAFSKLDVNVYERSLTLSEWQKQEETDKKEMNKISKKQSDNDKQCTDKAKELALANSLIKNFTELDKSRLSFKNHNEKAEEMKTLSLTHKKNETAVRNVKPVYDNWMRIKNDLSIAAKNTAEAENEFISAGEKKNQAINALSELPALDDVQEKYNKANKLWESENNKLTELKMLLDTKNRIALSVTELSELQDNFKKLNTKYDELNKNFSRIESVFMSNQAGILAATLNDDIPCPVCGSITHPHLAEISVETPTEDKVRKAKIAAENARKARDEQLSVCTSKKSAIDTEKERFVNDFAKFDNRENYDDASSNIETMVSAASEVLETLKKDKDEALAVFTKLKNTHEVCVRAKTKAEAEYKSAETLLQERKVHKDNLIQAERTSKKKYSQVLADNSFKSDDEFLSFAVDEMALKSTSKMLSDYETEGKMLINEIAKLESETNGKEKPNISEIEEENRALEEIRQNLRNQSLEVKGRLSDIQSKIKDLISASKEYEQNEKIYSVIKPLCDAANGKLEFETYAQTAYFDRVLRAANLRLQIMSQNRYLLLRKQDSDDNRKKTGLDIEVADSYTGKSRSTKSLSGGESFMASLSLAFGLSDVIQQSVGGIKLDAMFIDEGFGSLDAETLDLAVRTLSGMAQGSRMIGIISHMNELRERIDKQIQVEKLKTGSKIIVSV